MALLGQDGLWHLLAQQGAAPKGDAGGLESYLTFLPIVAIVMVFYLIMIRPDQKKRKEKEAALASLKVNDHVVTIGGIAGTVVNISAEAKFVTIRVDDKTGTKIKVLRSAISQVGTLEELTEDEKATTK